MSIKSAQLLQEGELPKFIREKEGRQTRTKKLTPKCKTVLDRYKSWLEEQEETSFRDSEAIMLAIHRDEEIQNEKLF